MHPMARIFIVGVALFAVLSVAGILITPDQSDDVDGAVGTLSCFAGPSALIVVRQPFLRRRPLRLSLPPTTNEIANLIDLVCVRLC